ncbi:MAG: ABC transporter ATP-binding protein [Promethearchaeota archaeon]
MPKTAEILLKIEDLSKEYQINQQEKLVVLHDICFSAFAGETLILMGPSGAGKSTLFNIIAGLEQASDGIVEVQSYNFSRLNDNEQTELRKKLFGIIFQFFELHQGLTCYETLELKLLIDKINETEYDSKIDYILDQVHLLDKKDVLVDLLSRGEKQRIAFARALINQPPIILADEPTGALDIDTSVEVMSLLRTMAKTFGSLLIISTHDYNVPQDGDRVLLLDDGRLTRDISSISREDFLRKSGLILFSS